MKKVATLVGCLTLAGSLAGGLFYSVDNFLPKPYEVEQKRGANIIYNRNGDVFVHSDPKNMLTYLLHEDPDRMRRAINEVEK